MFDEAVFSRTEEHVRAARLDGQLVRAVPVLPEPPRLARAALGDRADANLRK